MAKLVLKGLITPFINLGTLGKLAMWIHIYEKSGSVRHGDPLFPDGGNHAENYGLLIPHWVVNLFLRNSIILKGIFKELGVFCQVN